MPVPDPLVTDPARLHVVTGKGGTGKTTAATALALALAVRGRAVLLVEAEGRQGIAQTLDLPPLGTGEEQVVTDPSGGSVTALSIDAKAALMEYLQTFYRLGRAGAVLERIGAVDFATTIAPGVRDVLVTGKVYEAVGRTHAGRSSAGRKRPGRPVYDAVVLDAPPTGRVARFLGVNTELADMAKVGPIRQQADAITALMQSEQTRVHLVTLLEEMPVQETTDAVTELSAAGLHLGAVVVNQVAEPLLPEDLLARLERDPAAVTARVVAALETERVRSPRTTGPAVVREAQAYAARLALQERMRASVAGLGLPVVELPQLGEGLDGGGIRLLADHLAERLAAPGVSTR